MPETTDTDPMRDQPSVPQAADFSLAAAASWGIRRHAAIATAAMERLQSGNAREKIVRILDEGGDPSLGDAATWPDRIRSNPPGDPATVRFLDDPRNQRHSRWHYVNLPLGVDGYDRQRYPEFTRDDDVVQMALQCVESLRTPGSHARFEEVIALRWLSHLIGDMHQPVHVGCGYIANAETDQARLVTSPDEAAGLPHDSGGNALSLPIGGNLHSFWDSRLGPNLIEDALNPLSDESLVRALALAPAPLVAAAAGIPDQVVAWANATLDAARAAYQSLRIVDYRPQQRNYRVEWEGEASYRQRCEPIVSERMSAAASNLASLLDSIWP